MAEETRRPGTDVYQRLSRAEESLQRLKVVFIVVLLLAAVGLWIAWSSRSTTVTAERFSLVDKQGRELASIEDPDGPGGNLEAQLRIYDPETAHFQAIVGADGLHFLTCPGVEDFAECATYFPSARYSSSGIYIDGQGIGGTGIELDSGKPNAPAGLRISNGKGRSVEITARTRVASGRG